MPFIIYPRKNRYGNPIFRFRGQDSGVTQIVTRPIDTVENTINSALDTFVPEPKDEEKKKSYKNAVRVGSTVLVLSTIVALLNPKISSKLIEKLKTKTVKAKNDSKNEGAIKGSWNKFKQITLTGLLKFIQIVNNGNSAKDEGFKILCSKLSILKKPHEAITRGFDKISKHTVFKKWNGVRSNIENTDKIIQQYIERLPVSERESFSKKMEEIQKIQKYFSESKVSERIKAQEDSMSNLEKETLNKMQKFWSEFWGKSNKKIGERLNPITTFWAEDAVMAQRTKAEKQGEKIVQTLFGDGKTEKGMYNELLEYLAPHLKTEEKAALEETINNSAKKIKSANKSECTEYFDKKRDLILGSAPTDVLTALISLGACGYALGTADNKEERISRTVTGVIPAIGGVATSLGLAALLVSGGLSIAAGVASSVVMGLAGSIINRNFIIKPAAKKEVINA